MNIQLIIDILLVIASYFFWNKFKDRQFLWFMWISVIAVLMDLSKIIFYPNLSPTFLMITRGFFIIFDLLIVLIVLKILWKIVKKPIANDDLRK